ncbi:MAG: exonuclease SbcCD subunit D, partial [Promethearchaeota archaeon]
RAGVPIYILPGNHERSKLPLGLLPFTNENIHLFSKPSSFIFKKNDVKIKLTGFPYIRRNVKRNFHSLVKKAWFHQREKTDFAILMIHQLIEGSCIENYTFRRGHNVIMFKQIPQKFNYIACGHVHRFQFLYNPRLGSIRSTNKFFSLKQHVSNHTWQFDGRLKVPSPLFRGPLLSYAGSLERVSLAERNEPKGYIIGQCETTKNGVQSIEYRFHNLPAVKILYINWDLYKATMTDYVDKTLDTLYNIHANSELQNQGENAITAIFRIRIRGNGSYSKKDIEYVREEARRCNTYLTFSYKA